MFTHEGNFFKIKTVQLNLSALKGVAVFEEWEDEDDLYADAEPVARHMVPINFASWDETSIEELDTELPTLSAEWIPYSTDGIPALLATPPNFSDNKVEKSRVIETACSNEILAGFESSALGDVHVYPSDTYDQINLSGTILRSALPSAAPEDMYPFKCMDDAGVWDFRFHTAEQIQQVGDDAYDFILAARYKNSVLQIAIEASETQEELDLIEW